MTLEGHTTCTLCKHHVEWKHHSHISFSEVPLLYSLFIFLSLNSHILNFMLFIFTDTKGMFKKKKQQTPKNQKPNQTTNPSVATGTSPPPDSPS